MKPNKILNLLLLTLLISGCATTQQLYHGDPQPSEEAIIKCESGYFALIASESFHIISADGQSLGSRLMDCPREVHVLPGQHEIVVRISNITGYSSREYTIPYSFEAKPGETYIFRKKYKYGWYDKYKFWVETLSTAEVVGIPIYYDGKKAAWKKDPSAGFTTEPLF